MTLDVIRGPFTSAPRWSPSTTTFVRTRKGLREWAETRAGGSFGDQVSWITEKIIGGTPQYWQVSTGEHPHPEVQLLLFGLGGILQFDIRLVFNVRVVDAKRALEGNVRNLDGYFTNALRAIIAPMANSYDMAQSHQLQQKIIDSLGGENRFGNDIAEIVHLTVQVRPSDPVAFENMKKLALVPTRRSAIEADIRVTKAEMEAFHQKTGGMTIDALARAAIATGNPQLMTAYTYLQKLRVEEGERNWERLKFLIDSKLIEPHDLERHLGPLGEDVIGSLVSRAHIPSQGTGMLERLRLSGSEVTSQNDRSSLSQGHTDVPERSTDELPATILDEVDCSAFAPRDVAPGTHITIQALLHRADALVAAAKLARTFDSRATRLKAQSLTCRIRRGTTVELMLECNDLTIENPIAAIVWTGGPDRAAFTVQIPATLPEGSINFRLYAAIDGITIGELEFSLRVVVISTVAVASPVSAPSDSRSEYQQVGDRSTLYRNAFISYARADFERVSIFAQGLEESGIGIFVDVNNLEPGMLWEQELGAEIDRADVFYLMWSKFAATSRYVEMEARQAVAFENDPARRRPRVKPITLEHGAPHPPDFLSKYHFNSRWLALREAQKSSLFGRSDD